MKRPRIAIVVPCYNESARLPVSAFEEFLTESSVTFVFVDDGSSDQTLAVLKRLRSGREDRVTVLRHASNRGKGEAVRCGVRHALEEQAEYVGFWDADLATPLAAIWDLFAVLEHQPMIDMVFGSRVKLLGRRIDRRPVRHYAGRLFATVVSLILRIPVYDTQCGAKLFRSQCYIRRLFNDPFISRWVFDVELIARYIYQVGSPKTAAAAIYEYPLDAWTDVKGSRLKLTDFGVALLDILHIYWKYMRGLSCKRMADAEKSPAAD